MMLGMDAPDAHHRLTELVKNRRKGQRLSLSAAARAAGINRDTWTDFENGTRRLREYNYAGIERALDWEPGSIDSILAGGDPKPMKGRPQHAMPGDDELVEEIERIRNLPISARARLGMIEALVAAHEEALAEGQQQTRGSRSA